MGEIVERIRGRALKDSAEGWLTLKDVTLKPWTPQYKCVAPTAIQEAVSVKTSNTIREAKVGEWIEHLEGPEEDTETGTTRIRGRSESDGVTGWITIHDPATSTRYLAQRPNK